MVIKVSDDQQADNGREIGPVPSLRAPAALDLEMSPIPGMDLLTFKNYMARALDGDRTVPAIFLNLANAARGGSAGGLEEHDASWWQEFFWRHAFEENLKAIDAIIHRYNEMADWHHAQAEMARQRMHEAADNLAPIDAFISDVDELFKEKESTGRLDREKAVRLLKARGIDVDPNEDEATILIRLKEEKDKARNERSKWSRQYEEAKGDADYNNRMESEDRRKARELIERRDAIRNGGYDPEQEARRLGQVTDEYKLDVQKKAAEVEYQKGDARQITELDMSGQLGVNRSQAADEEVNFMASADNLTRNARPKPDSKVADTPQAAPIAATSRPQ